MQLLGSFKQNEWRFNILIISIIKNRVPISETKTYADFNTMQSESLHRPQNVGEKDEDKNIKFYSIYSNGLDSEM